VQYYLEEVKGSIDYQGWAGKQDQDNTDGVNLVTVRFAWNGDGDADVEIKPLSTFLCGRSFSPLLYLSPAPLDEQACIRIHRVGGRCWEGLLNGKVC
jgi:hypothetical protein